MFQFLKKKIKKFHFGLKEKIKNIFSREKDDFAYEELEKLFYEADLGVETATELVESLKKQRQKTKNMTTEEVLLFIKQKLLTYFSEDAHIEAITQKPHVILITGANGSGKTTSLIKLAHFFYKQNKKVLVVAADTFRAAAIEQLEKWAKKIQVDIVKSLPNADAAAVVYDALTKAKAKNYDIVLIDIAGRLHTKTHLMNEIPKITSVCQKLIPDAPHEVLLTIDATTGQNAIDQAINFHKYHPLTGLILTKLDGTAKAGVAIALQRKMKIPILWIGVGEKEKDLYPFDPQKFVEALLS